MVEHETEEILAPVTKLKNSIVSMLFFSITLAIFIGVYLSRTILMPVEKLKQGIFIGSKKIVQQEVLKERPLGLDFQFQEQEEILAGFECLTLTTTVKPTKKDESNTQEVDSIPFDIKTVSRFQHTPGKMAVFSYNDRAIIMVFAVLGENFRKIINALSSTKDLRA